MTVSEVIEEHLPGVEEFLDELERSTGSGHDEEYRHVQGQIRFAQRFYEDFLSSAFQVEITSFSFSDKRLVAEKIDQVESEERGTGESGAEEDRQLDLAYRYLEICDQLHEDLLFGYSEDVADYFAFHEETFPDWLDEVETWLKADGKSELAMRVGDVVRRYRRVA